MINTSPIEVGKLIRSLKKSHSSHCGISGKFLQLISTQISYSLSRLYNNLFEKGHFPKIWKIAHISAIYKRSGPKNSKSSFRPISILPTLSKVCESVIHERLLSHCSYYDIISERQAAYLRGDSTITQLSYIIHYIRSSWGNSKIVQGAFLDISSAFDKVWHKGLLSKLSHIGIDGNFLDLFHSYLSQRKQCVIVDGEKSTFLEVKAGVPQGSRFGPLLFIIYINGIKSEMLIFADDTTILASGHDPAESATQLNSDLQKISDWAKTWKVQFNTNKSKDIIFSKKYLNNSPPLVLNNESINRVNIHKHLGVYLSSTLDWSKQIDEICLRATRKLAVLRSIKYLSRKTLDLLYKTIVRSIIDYSLPILANNLKQTELGRLERLQYKAAKLVTGALHFSSQEKLNLDLGWESIKKRIEFLGLCLFHKIHLHLSRPLVRKCLTKLDWEGTRKTRSKGGYLPYPNHGRHFLNSFFPHMSRLWNNLPNTTKCKNLQDFKIQLNGDIKPHKIKHNSKGSKEGNCLLTRTYLCLVLELTILILITLILKLRLLYKVLF